VRPGLSAPHFLLPSLSGRRSSAAAQLVTRCRSWPSDRRAASPSTPFSADACALTAPAANRKTFGTMAGMTAGTAQISRLLQLDCCDSIVVGKFPQGLPLDYVYLRCRLRLGVGAPIYPRPRRGGMYRTKRLALGVWIAHHGHRWLGGLTAAFAARSFPASISIACARVNAPRR